MAVRLLRAANGVPHAPRSDGSAAPGPGAAACAPTPRPDPYLWVTDKGGYHLLYHRMNDGQQTGGHGFSVDGRNWTWGPPA